MLNQQQKTDPSGSAIKTLAATSFAPKMTSTYTKKLLRLGKPTKQPQPHCESHNKLAKMHVVKDLMKANYGRPFFVRSDQSNPCSFWAWSDVQPVAKPECCHRIRCVVRKVKKETVNKDRLFFCCSQQDSCNYFEWVPEEAYRNAKLLPSKQDDECEEQYPTEDFQQSF